MTEEWGQRSTAATLNLRMRPPGRCLASLSCGTPPTWHIRERLDRDAPRPTCHNARRCPASRRTRATTISPLIGGAGPARS